MRFKGKLIETNMEDGNVPPILNQMSELISEFVCFFVVRKEGRKDVDFARM